MSERIQRSIRLSEVKTIRLVCKDRNDMTLEIPIDRLKDTQQKLDSDLCPVCDKEVWSSNQPKKQTKNPYAHLILSLLELRENRYDRLDIEIVIPEGKSTNFIS